MGVHGLWRLIEPSGKPVPLETLENKVLAVDVSIWLHQFIKGFQDSKGATVPNAHLLGIYHRVCKLLYFRIKPVFVFDGGVPVLKKNTIAQRNQRKQKSLSEADQIHKNLLAVLVKHTAISKVLSEKAKAAITASTSPTKKNKPDEDELYVLPPSQFDSTVSSNDESDEESHSSKHFDLHSIDTESVEFKSLPADVRHEILSDLKETRKQSSWGKIHELPTESTDFSSYQVSRLLKRQSVQSALEEVEKEMGGHSLSLGELEKILKDQGVISSIKGSRIASDENTRFVLIKNIKQALEEARKENLATITEIEEENQGEAIKETTNKRDEEDEEENQEEVKKTKNKGDEEFEDDIKKAIELSLKDVPSTSGGEAQPSTSTEVKNIGVKGKKRISLSFLGDFEDADFDDSESSGEEEIRTKLTPAQRYMMEYSGLSAHTIAKIIEENSKSKRNIPGKKKISIQPAESTSDIYINQKPEAEVENENSEALNSIEDIDLNQHGEKAIIEEKSELKNEDSEVTSTEAKQKPESLVEVMSDSEESNVDFVEVGQNQKEEGEIEKTILDTSKDKESTKENLEVTSTEINQKPESSIEVMSDSGESSDDFVEVVEKKSTENAMEVVIKPDEAMDDDFFKDIFETEDKLTEDVDKLELKSSVQTVSSDKEKEVLELETKIVEKPKSTSEKTLAKIDQMIKTYSKPKEKTPEVEEKLKITKEQLKEIKENLQKEQNDLVAEKSSKERLAGNISDQMCKEAQELLELFGVPYLVAPMEAEAQCAFLDLIELTDGTITDDSDIWLFGGRTVYKNFFDQNKIVMEFKADSIQRTFKLSREQMILLAMLVGSDYTVGLSGVGPVTALEILAAFPPKNHLVSGLSEFKSWFHKGKLPGPGRTTLRGKLKNVIINENFPNPQIAQAYLEPTVETSREQFTWAKPDIPGLIEFARQKFGWTKTKSEEILAPILRRLEDNRAQKAITDYFKLETVTNSKKDAEKLALMSKRVKSAIEKIAGGPTSDAPDEPAPKKNVRKKKADSVPGTSSGKKKKMEGDEEIGILKETQKRSKKRVKEIETEVLKGIEEKEKKTVELNKKLHLKEVIPQRQKDKAEILKNKLKAIETFRKSKQGPGFVKKREKVRRGLHKDTSYLSEDSGSD